MNYLILTVFFRKSEHSLASAKRFFKRHIQEYCNNTTIHGLKYVGEPNRTVFER